MGDERHNVLDIHPPGFSHGSGLDGDARQHQDASRERCEEGGEKEGQHYRDGAVRVDQRAREVGRKKRAEMVTRCASHCNRPFFFTGRRSSGWPSPPCADGAPQPAKTNTHRPY